MQGFVEFSEVYCYKSNVVVQHICGALPCKKGKLGTISQKWACKCVEIVSHSLTCFTSARGFWSIMTIAWPMSSQGWP